MGRTVQSVNTRYNVHFNGKQSYDEAMKAIADANQDDYGQIIHMYPISNHENANAAAGQLDRTIEKCRKAIKTRSIKTKPKHNSRKASKQKYKAFMEQEEYNPYMHKVWLLLAQAEFHKADFLGAVGTFNYIARHFKENQDLGMTCQLWVIRSYAELGWIYEAEELLSKLESGNLQGDNVGLYAAVHADLLLKKQQYREAIPFLEMAYSREKDKYLKTRFSFLLAQLYQQTGNKKKAADAYSTLIKKSPPYEMEFNARVNRASLFLGGMKDTRSELRRMARNFNNRDYLDQIYFALGKSYMHVKDTLKALEYYQEAVDNSTRNGVDKALVLVNMGDLYYTKQQYVEAQPCYEEASQIFTVEYADYARIAKRSEVLSELVVQHEIVLLQDSLQRLSAKSPEERLKSIKAYMAQKALEEKLAAERDEKMQRRMEENQERASQSAAPQFMGANAQNEWYFYNPNLMRSGQTEFQSRWGRRKLEDNWRRKNKTAVLFEEEETKELATDSIMANDSIYLAADGEIDADELTLPDEPEEELNEDNPEFYLRQIPETPEQLAHSSLLWSEALFNMGMIYKDKLEDYNLALASFKDYSNRFPNYELVPDAWYHSYLILMKLAEKDDAELFRFNLLNQYPNSKYSVLLEDPNYIETRRQMYVEQDSMYREAYLAFNQNNFNKVFSIVDQVNNRFPGSSLMPKFLFLRALGVAKTRTQDQFETELISLVEKYPESDVSSISKDMLALIKQGREAQLGTTHGSILERRELETKAELLGDVSLAFKQENKAEHRVIFVSNELEEALYDLQFQLAVFNFSKFLLQDFDLNISALDEKRNAVSVYAFDSYEDAEWYISAIYGEKKIEDLITALDVYPMVISEYNFGLLRAGFSFDDYLIYKIEMDSN